jgi:hypothetical protein
VSSVPGGTYLSQQVGAESNKELSDFLTGPSPSEKPGRLRPRSPEPQERGSRYLTSARRRSRSSSSMWRPSCNSCKKCSGRSRLQRPALQGPPSWLSNDAIERSGSFVSYSTRFLIEANKPLAG